MSLDIKNPTYPSVRNYTFSSKIDLQDWIAIEKIGVFTNGRADNVKFNIRWSLEIERGEINL